jgi:hypothetical protein
MTKHQDLTEGQRAYEARRAAKAGMSLEKWLAEKDKRARTEAAEAAKEAQLAAKSGPPGRKGWFGRLIERAQQPLK